MIILQQADSIWFDKDNILVCCHRRRDEQLF